MSYTAHSPLVCWVHFWKVTVYKTSCGCTGLLLTLVFHRTQLARSTQLTARSSQSSRTSMAVAWGDWWTSGHASATHAYGARAQWQDAERQNITSCDDCLPALHPAVAGQVDGMQEPWAPAQVQQAFQCCLLQLWAGSILACRNIVSTGTQPAQSAYVRMEVRRQVVRSSR